MQSRKKPAEVNYDTTGKWILGKVYKYNWGCEYFVEHNCGRSCIKKQGSYWVARGEVEGEIQYSGKTRKDVVNWLIGTYGIWEY
jgi:hypothetical protein